MVKKRFSYAEVFFSLIAFLIVFTMIIRGYSFFGKTQKKITIEENMAYIAYNIYNTYPYVDESNFNVDGFDIILDKRKKSKAIDKLTIIIKDNKGLAEDFILIKDIYK